ncbi:MAG TPA: protein kinase [Gemmatimonadaceae bacterium]
MERELGAGGMATVYLAEDVQHHRRVAVKVLHPELSAVLGPERFIKEIELTASLQHPHILPLFDSGSVDGRLYYVMPFVEGETLRARLDRENQLPVADAVRIATEAADALQYAHERGVVHRDVKPENILLQNGHALVADFGIALAVEQAGGARMTQTGLSLGTPQYMAPEQAMGQRNVDARADIYALGAVTYEMLAGEPPFTGSSAQAIIGRVMTDEPKPLQSHRRSVPAHVDEAVRTALEKLPADRFGTVSEFAAALSAPGAKRRASARTRGPTTSPATWLPALALGLALGGALGAIAWARFRPAVEMRPLHASVLPPPGCTFAPVATTNLVQLSPDGERLAFIAECGTDQALWVRSLASGEVRKLPGTAHASYPFWSPDGASLGFFADNRLKRVDLESGAVRDLAPALNGRGASWSRDDVILYAPDIEGPLYRIAASGGAPQAATSTAEEKRGASHRVPYFLPDGHHFVFADAAGGLTGTVRVGELGSTRTRVLLDGPSNVAVADGKLLYVTTTGLLMARPFDARTATFTGAATSLVPRVESWPYRYLGNFSVAAAVDLLIYRPAPVERNRVSWFDPRSATSATLLDPGPYLQVRLSPEGGRVLLERREPESSLRSVALYDVPSRTWSAMTSRPAVYYTFAWSPDGTRIALTATDDPGVTVTSADRTRTQILREPQRFDFIDWRSDSADFIGQYQRQGTGWDLVAATMGGSSPGVVPLVATAADESGARVSPDRRMLAFVSNETGRDEVFVTRLSDPATRWQVSQDGVRLDPTAHRAPLAWSRSGKGIYFADAGGHLVSVTVDQNPTMRIGRPAPVAGAPDDIIDLDAASDGRLLLIRSESSGEAPLEIITHWTASRIHATAPR